MNDDDAREVWVSESNLGEVELIRESISDLTVVNAARVSNAKRVDRFVARADPDYLTEREARGMGADDRLIQFLYKNNHWTPFGHARFGFPLVMDPERFTAWLANRMPGWEVALHGERTAFISGSLWNWMNECPPIADPELAHAVYHRIALSCPVSIETAGGVNFKGRGSRLFPDYARFSEFDPGGQPFTFRVKAPIFVVRQWFRSTVGFVINETSRRYIDAPPEFFRPRVWRDRAKDIKQGSGSGIVETIRVPGALEEGFIGPTSQAYEVPILSAANFYASAIEANIAPELARIALPLSTMTEFWITGTTRAWVRFISLRTKRFQTEVRINGSSPNHAQEETAWFAETIASFVDRLHPRLLDAVYEASVREDYQRKASRP